MTNRPKIGPVLRTALGVSAVLSPLAALHLKRRLNRGKEDPERWREKLGQTQAQRPGGPLIWLHGVGLGEVMALRGLITALSEARDDLRFLITSSARSSGEVFAHNLPPRTQHQYLALDLRGPVTRFLDHWRPDLVVWSDQEIWPRFAVSCARRAIPQAYVAARLTLKSSKVKSGFGDAYGELYRLLDLRHAQNEPTAETMRSLMGDGSTVHVTGSMKAAAAPLIEDAGLRATLPSDRLIWVAASAHRADVDIALKAQHLPRAQDAQDRLLIIVPRDLADADYIVQECRALSLPVAQLSAGDTIDDTTQVYIADSFGALGTWYRASCAALIGGTFDSVNGHNPWEAVAVGCPVLHGPHVANFLNDFESLNAAKGARPVKTADDIVAALADPNLHEIAQRATAVRDAATQGLAKITSDLLGLLKV